MRILLAAILAIGFSALFSTSNDLARFGAAAADSDRTEVHVDLMARRCAATGCLTSYIDRDALIELVGDRCPRRKCGETQKFLRTEGWPAGRWLVVPPDVPGFVTPLPRRVSLQPGAFHMTFVYTEARSL